jgi:lipopolysaccharide/colanic/teichoic acid biosynthesis glycosyltransferase
MEGFMQRVEVLAERSTSRVRLLDPDCFWFLYPRHPRVPSSWPKKKWTRFRAQDKLKHATDRAASALLLIILLPVLCLVAIAIKLDTKGPILFRQLRVGQRGRLFAIFKFRTMDHASSDLVAAQQTELRDRRITKVGRVLRKYSIDEVPQLLNVVLGQMSLVGPRPLAPGTSIDGVSVDKLLADFWLRHEVRPGITGLAQARGLRGALTTFAQLSARFAADIEYVRRRSLWLDLKIVAKTALQEARRPQGS